MFLNKILDIESASEVLFFCCFISIPVAVRTMAKTYNSGYISTVDLSPFIDKIYE